MEGISGGRSGPSWLITCKMKLKSRSKQDQAISKHCLIAKVQCSAGSSVLHKLQRQALAILGVPVVLVYIPPIPQLSPSFIAEFALKEITSLELCLFDPPFGMRTSSFIRKECTGAELVSTNRNTWQNSSNRSRDSKTQALAP